VKVSKVEYPMTPNTASNCVEEERTGYFPAFPWMVRLHRFIQQVDFPF
jgi:hypothetical protein